ncbi:MAG: hypothetical protein J6L00_00220, partial [Clostridia bacterium]|nr:hypothetical protein [Clostridia bacterium]
MFCKKSLSAILSLVMVVTMVVSVIAMPAAAATENGNVPFSSPAITANVGETIDLTKYGVEFAEGVSTKDGLTWWKNTASTVVPFKQPAILANVGDTVDLTQWGVEFADGVVTDAANISWQKKLDPKTVTFGMPAILTDVGTKIDFANYPVELTKGNVVAGSKLTWTQLEQSATPLVTFESPAIPANVGDVIDLAEYAVEFADGVATRPADITWKNGDTAVTSFTPNAKGVTALTATADGVTKTIYVVAKNAEDTKYVLYRNDFDSADAVAEMHKSTMGTPAATATYADGGYLSHLRNGAADASNQSMLFAPDWLCDFGAYRLEARVSVSAYGKPDRYFSFLTHGSNTAKSGPYYVAGFAKNGTYWFQKNVSATTWGLTNLSVTINKASAFTMNVDTYYTYALEYANNTVASYIDGTQIMESVASDATPIVTGRPGIGFHGVDATADYFEVALADNSLKTATFADALDTYTPAAKGVTAFEVSDGETTKTVYVVAKNAEDTEYVLYENDFNEAADLDDLTLVLNGAGTESITDGKFNFVRNASTSASNRAYMLPEWLCDFSDYTLEMNAAVNAQASTSRYIGFLYHGQTGSDARPYIITAFDRKKQVIWGDRSTAETNWNPNWYAAKTNAYTIPALGTAATYKLTVAGDALSVFYNGTEVASTVLPDTAPEKGRPGIMTAGIDFDIDNYKVVLTEPAKTETVTAFTPATAGVTELVATVNGVSKSVYVVAKEESDNEYVLYQNDFDTAASLADVTRLAGGTDANYPLGISDGNLTITRVNNNSGNTTIGFPMWLADFGDYTIESSIAITAQTNTSRYYGLVFRGNPSGSYAPHYVSVYKRNGIWQGQTRVSTTATNWDASWDNWAGPSITGAFSAAALNTYATHKVEVKGDTATAYYNGAQVG